jgi:hypothetical protein
VALDEALVRGLKQTPRRGGRRHRECRVAPQPRDATPYPAPAGGLSHAAAALDRDPARRSADPHGFGRRLPAGADRDLAHDRDEESPATQPRRLALPRAVWLGGALAAIVWQLAAGRPGVALLLLAAAAPLILLPRHSGLGWLTAALAPALAAVGLAAAFPALAGQRARLTERAALAALGYWWLILAEPLLDRSLWLGVPAGTPARAAWEASLSSAATHVVGPSLGLGVLYGAAVWATAAVLLPWVVRGRSAVLDALAASAWSLALLLACAPHLAGYTVSVVTATPRGAVLGTIFGGAFAVAARALRGPV